MALKEQMELFNDGGLKQEGGTIDPISGNDVPVGSTQEEVRDDIPAQLSEGEFVFPADVVRYIGLEKLMQMRQEAKRGLEMMDKMGQMGNGDEAVIPDNIPFELSDLDMEDDLEYNVGGLLDPVESKVDSDIRTRDVEQDDISDLPETYTPPKQEDVPMQPDYSGLTFKDIMPEITPSYFKNRKPTSTTQTAETPASTTPDTKTSSEPAPTTEEQNILPPLPEDPKITETGLTPEDPASPFDLENTSGYKGDTIAEQQKTSDEQMAQFYDGVTQEQKDAQELINLDPVRTEVFNQFNNLGEVDKSKIYDAYGIDQGDFKGLISKAGTNFLKQFTTSMIGGVVGGVPGLLAGSQVGRLFDKDSDKEKGPVLTDTQNLNRERASMALGIEMTGKVGHNKGDIDPKTGYVYNRYGVPINPTTGDAVMKIKFSDLGSLSKSLQANGKSGWQGGYIGTKDSPRYKNLNPTQKARYDKYVEELDKLYGFTDEPATYATTQQVAGRPLTIDDEDAGGKTPSPEFTTPVPYDQIMQELQDEDEDTGKIYTGITNQDRENLASEFGFDAGYVGGVGGTKDSPASAKIADQTRRALEEARQAEALRIRQEEIEEEARQKAEAAALAAEVARIKKLEAKRKADAKKKADAKANERARKLREKRDKEKVKRITKNMSASKARSVRQAVKKQGGRLATGGRAKGGLMKRSSKQPLNTYINWLPNPPRDSGYGQPQKET